MIISGSSVLLQTTVMTVSTSEPRSTGGPATQHMCRGVSGLHLLSEKTRHNCGWDRSLEQGSWSVFLCRGGAEHCHACNPCSLLPGEDLIYAAASGSCCLDLHDGLHPDRWVNISPVSLTMPLPEYFTTASRKKPRRPPNFIQWNNSSRIHPAFSYMSSSVDGHLWLFL